MHQMYSIFLILLLLFLQGCEEKSKDNNASNTKNTTLTSNNKTHTSKTNNNLNVYTQTKAPSTDFKRTFILNNSKNRRFTIELSNKKMTIKENHKNIVLITLFASWCPPCMYEIPYLNDLQKKYRKNLFLAGVLVHDPMNKSTVKTFIAKHSISYYVSNSVDNNNFAKSIVKTLQLPKNFPIPLSIMYVNGKYFTHYEGIVPVEMIEYDIEEAMKTLK